MSEGLDGSCGDGGAECEALPHIELGQPVVEIAHEESAAPFSIVERDGVPYLAEQASKPVPSVAVDTLTTCTYLNTLSIRDRLEPPIV